MLSEPAGSAKRIRDFRSRLPRIIGFPSLFTRGERCKTSPPLYVFFCTESTCGTDESFVLILQCPDFGQTGHSLQSIISDLFSSTINVAVKPFFSTTKTASGGEGEGELDEAFEELEVGEERRGLKNVLDVEVSKAW